MNSNDIIKNEFLRDEFEAYLKINSEEDKETHMKWAANRFNNLSEAEKEEVRQAWIGNVGRIREAVHELGYKVGLMDEDFKNNENDIQPFTPEQQQKYNIAISGLDAGDGKPYEEFMTEMKKKSSQ